MAVENLPAAHSSHVLDELAPVIVEKVPLPHDTQSSTASLPVEVKYVPAGQSVHVPLELDPTTVEYLPRAHGTQSEACVLPSREKKR